MSVGELMSMIEARAGVRSGKPCFIGTRIAVYDLLDYLGRLRSQSPTGRIVSEATVRSPPPTG